MSILSSTLGYLVVRLHYWKKYNYYREQMNSITASLGWERSQSYPPVWKVSEAGLKVDVGQGTSATTQAPLYVEYSTLRQLLEIAPEDVPRELVRLQGNKPALPPASRIALAAMLVPFEGVGDLFRDKYIRKPFLTRRLEIEQ